MTDEFTGRLREAVAIEHWHGDPDDLGGIAAAWVPLGFDWAAVVPIERGFGDAVSPVAGEAKVARPRFRVTLRARDDVGLATRLRWRGHLLSVIRVEPDPRTPDRITLLVESRT